MKVLVVEGNTKETRKTREVFGIKPYNKIFTEMLHFLEPNVQVDIAFPTDKENILPTERQLQNYGGVLITGSSLSVLDAIPEVTCQLDFIETVFKSGTPIYGSCWGLQVATVVAGGKVSKSNNGLEFGISEPINLTEAGKQSPYFKNRKEPFGALCIHYDEICETPKNAVVLAENSHSDVQAMEFSYKKASFFGVQYHPEFTPKIMSKINMFLSDKLVNSSYYHSLIEANNYSIELEKQDSLLKEVKDYDLHTQDIKAWLNNLVKK